MIPLKMKFKEVKIMNENKLNINWYPGHMAKAKREIIESLKLIDVVLELVDSRIPLSSRNPDIDEIVGSKPRIILLNKSDLSDSEKTKQWVKYFFSKKIPAIPTDSNSGKGLNEVTKKIFEIMKTKIDQNASKGRVGTTIRVAVLGIPNVGKSSLINKLANKKSLEVGNKPGVTKRKQWIRLKNNVELLDTPGVLWPKFESEEVALNLAFTGTIKDEIIDTEEIGMLLLGKLKAIYPKELAERYKLKQEDLELENLELLTLIGKKRGCIISGGEVDLFKVSNIILDEFRAGKIGKLTIENIVNN